MTAAASLNAEPSNGSGAVSEHNGRSVSTVTDTVEQPRLRGKKRSRFSIRRHLQKHGLAQPDSDSDLETDESE